MSLSGLRDISIIETPPEGRRPIRTTVGEYDEELVRQALEREQIELGQLEPLRDFCFCTDGARGHLTVAAHGTPGDVYVYGQGENISMERWAAMILRVNRIPSTATRRSSSALR